ncbi:MAG: prepilin-type N-terminal cleavage/methylation domain-containing protein [Gemmatimonadales bacterium]
MSHRGESLVELLVALVILEIAGVAALATALTVERIGRRVERGSAEDTRRWVDYRQRESDTACVAAAAPDTVRINYPATAERPAFSAVVRCGP